MKKDALTNKPRDIKIADLVGLTLRLCRKACEEGLLSTEYEVHARKDIPKYYIEFVRLICDGCDPDYIIEYASIIYYMSCDRGERFRIFVSLYLLLFIQDGCRAIEIDYFARLFMDPEERSDTTCCYDESAHKEEMHDRAKHYLSQEEVGRLLSGID